ncbi:hypothetical protein [Membranihabitans maritimus]|uniref:hypothetical protein n=1 Tax=Membranihabitans maritimus TaxID=2904244 RepID=UPI001F1C3E6E|nr:hypothetical protein [Membranihabitans maritimus]
MNGVIRCEEFKRLKNQRHYNPINTNRIDCVNLYKRTRPKGSEVFKLTIEKDGKTIINTFLWKLYGYGNIYFGNNDRGEFQTLIILGISVNNSIAKLYFPSRKGVYTLKECANRVRVIFNQRPDVARKLTRG